MQDVDSFQGKRKSIECRVHYFNSSSYSNGDLLVWSIDLVANFGDVCRMAPSTFATCKCYPGGDLLSHSLFTSEESDDICSTTTWNFGIEKARSSASRSRYEITELKAAIATPAAAGLVELVVSPL